MRRLLVLLPLLLIGCSQKQKLPKLTMADPYVILIDIPGKPPAHLPYFIEQIRKSNRDTDILILAPRKTRKSIRIKNTQALPRERFTPQELVDGLKLDHAFLVDVNTIVYESLGHFLNFEALDGITHLSYNSIPTYQDRPTCFVKDPSRHLNKVPCEFVSSWGLRANMDHILDETTSFNPLHVKPKATIYVKTSYLSYFFKKLHPKIKHPYILVSHEGPLPKKLARYCQSPKLIAWFAEGEFRDGIIPLPVGISKDNPDLVSLMAHTPLLKDLESFPKNISEKTLYYLFLKRSKTVDATPSEALYWDALAMGCLPSKDIDPNVIFLDYWLEKIQALQN